MTTDNKIDAGAAAPASTTVLGTAGDSLDYQVGNPEFEGRTTVRVLGDSTAEATFTQGGKTKRYSGQVTPAQLKSLRDSLTAHPIADYRPVRRDRVPDEAEIELTLVTGGKRSEKKLLSNERYKLAGLDKLCEQIEQIASKVSGGKIEY